MKGSATHKIKESGPERLRGADFIYEFDIEQDLFELIDRGNFAALNAVSEDYPARLAKVGPHGYSKGFCYGKIGNFGYIVLKDDLENLEVN